MNTRESIFSQDGISMNYKLFYPDKTEGLPLLIYLHGAGERGDCPEVLDHIARHGIPRLITEGREIPAVVLCPQCPTAFVWDNIPDKVKALIDETAKAFSVAPDRILLTGSSMGGFGTWMLAMTYPTLFAAIAPISGGAMSWRASNLISTPVLAVHGKEDTLVPPAYSEMPVKALAAQGGDAELILLDGQGHNDGIDYAYRNERVIDWLLSHRRTDFTPVPEFCHECF